MRRIPVPSTLSRAVMRLCTLVVAWWLPTVGVAQPAAEVQVRFKTAVALMDAGRDADARAVFDAIHESFPDLPDPLNNIALLQARAGQLEPARQSLEAALRNDPTHRNARLNLAQVHLMLALQAWEAAARLPVGAPAGDRTNGDAEALQRTLTAARALLATAAR